MCVAGCLINITNMTNILQKYHYRVKEPCLGRMAKMYDKLGNNITHSVSVLSSFGYIMPASLTSYTLPV